MKIKNHLAIVFSCLLFGTVSYLVFKYLVLPDLDYHHEWQIRGQEERTGSAILKKRYTIRLSQMTYYTYYLEGKDDAPSLHREKYIIGFEPDSSLTDPQKVWNIFLSIDTLSEIPIKWTIAKNGSSVFTEINHRRDIGETNGSSAVFGAFIISGCFSILMFMLLIISFFQWIRNKN